MAIAVGTAVTAIADSAATVTIVNVPVSATPGGLLVCGFSISDQAVVGSRARWGSRELMQLAAISSAGERVEIWFDVGMPAATRNVVFEVVGGTADIAAGAVPVTGVDQGQPFGGLYMETGNSAAPSVTVEPNAGIPLARSVVLGVLAASMNALDTRTATPAAGLTSSWNFKTNPPGLGAVIGAMAYRVPASAAQPVDWTLNIAGTWAVIGTSLNPLEFSIGSRVSALEVEVNRIGAYQFPV